MASWATLVLRDGICHEVLFGLVHCTTKAVQSPLLQSPGPPNSSTRRHVHGEHVQEVVVLPEYVALTTWSYFLEIGALSVVFLARATRPPVHAMDGS